MTQNDARFRRAVKIKNPKLRMRRVTDICKGTKFCDASTEQKTDPHTGEVRPGHSGCGGVQPRITKEGLKFSAEFDKVTDESIEKKQNLSAEKVFPLHLKHSRFVFTLSIGSPNFEKNL